MPVYKCKYCKESITDKNDEVKVSIQGEKRVTNRYFHSECMKLQELKDIEKEKRVEFLKKEKEEIDSLDLFVKKVHNVPFDLPKRFYIALQDLRNGTNRGKFEWTKKYKEGVPYHIIELSYRLALSDIERAKLSKRFKNFEEELMYCFAIARNKINEAWRKHMRDSQVQKQQKAKEVSIMDMLDDTREVAFKKQENNGDFSYLFGDD